MVHDHAILLLDLSLDIERRGFRIFLSVNSQCTNNPSLLWETAKAYIIQGYNYRLFRQEQQVKLKKELADIKSALCLTSNLSLLRRKCAIQAALNTTNPAG